MSARWRRWKRSLRRRWDRMRAPWPIVNECHGHLREPVPKCSQCDASHGHIWIPWENAPRWVKSGPGVPIRCRICGARKCDAEECSRRRHSHTHWQEATP